jgi:hypothetical protein
VEPDEVSDEPFCNLIYPIIDSRDSIDGFDGENEVDDDPVVATIATTIYWREILECILPDGRSGLIVVFKNNCTDSFTYELK